MARLKTRDISQELRNLLANHVFTSFTPVDIPTGRDPRRLQQTDDFPMLMVHVASTVAGPHGIGGSAKAWHGVRIFWADKYLDNEDVNEKKLAAAEELFDFLCLNYCGATYKLFVADEEGSLQGWPTIDYEPLEEQAYEDHDICLLKIEFAVRQISTFSILTA